MEPTQADINAPTDAPFIDSTHPEVIAFARQITNSLPSPCEKAVALYYRIRDDIRYTPYLDFSDPEMYRASSVLRNGYGFCISKASLLAACARAAGIPARVGFADVRNHLITPRLLKMNGSDLMRWHAYTELSLDGRWVKATPAFNIELCNRFRVSPLEFDGIEDSIFHPYDADHRLHMEYVVERGVFDDIPFAEILSTFREYCPGLLDAAAGGDFAAEARPC